MDSHAGIATHFVKSDSTADLVNELHQNHDFELALERFAEKGLLKALLLGDEHS